jgi:hypothetical protein
MPSNTQLHTVQCPLNGDVSRSHTDEAKRLSDEYRLHKLGLGHGAIGRWFAVRMQDCISADVHSLYDSRPDAVAHQPGNPNYYIYVQIVPSDMPVCDAEIYLAIQRKLHTRGMRTGDGRGMIPRLLTEDMHSQLSAILRGGKPSNLRLPKG